MKAKVRLFLFLSALLIFLVGGAYLIALAQGWILDFGHFRIIKTGGLYLKFIPADSTLAINGKKINFSRELIGGGVLVNNLLPDSYKIELTKDGFQSWWKNLSVEPGQVTAATKIKLWPEKIQTEIVSNELFSDFWLTNQGFIYKNGQTLHFKNSFLKGDDVILASPDSNYIVTIQDKNYFLTDLKNTSSALNLGNLFNSLKQQKLGYPGLVPIKSVYFHPFSPNKIIIATAASIYTLDLAKIDLSENIRGTNIIGVSASNNAVFALDGGNRVFSANLILGTTDSINFGTSTEFKNLRVAPDGKRWFLTDKDGNLSLSDSSRQPPSKIASAAVFDLSPDGKSILFLDRNSRPKIFYLENYNEDFHKLAGASTILPLPDLKPNSNLEWLPFLPGRFLVLNDGKITISEMDPRPSLNSFFITENIKKYILDKNVLYVLKNSGELLKIDLGQ